jgi:hypothetical protein
MAATLSLPPNIEIQCPEPIETASDWAVKIDRLSLVFWLSLQIREYEDRPAFLATEQEFEQSKYFRAKAEALKEVIAHIEAMQK